MGEEFSEKAIGRNELVPKPKLYLIDGRTRIWEKV
jgi:hypothetical protein